MDFAAARGIADAVFYEGYLLYPYTATAPKNKLRWQFGIVVPRIHEAAGTGEHGHQQTEVIFDFSADACIDVLFRFLQIEARQIEARRGDAFVPVAALTAGSTRYLSFDESIEREVTATLRPSVATGTAVAIGCAGNRQVEDIIDADGTIAGRIVRQSWPLTGVLSLECGRIEHAGGPAARLRVRVENTSDVVAAAERGVVLRTAFVSSHTLIGITGGSLWSPIDPPDEALATAVSPVNEFTWPVLIGDRHADERRAAIVLSAPIVLADFPQIAHNTTADAFDATEIDELLNLAVLSLSDAERAEARATDPRARAIIERAEAFGAPDVARTHARFTSADGDVPVFGSPGSLEASAAPVCVEVGGVTVTKGSSVRLVPKRRADAWDMFLAGKIATVAAIHQDFEDKIYVAVTVDDDPASEQYQSFGRAFFFEPDEVEPLGAPA